MTPTNAKALLSILKHQHTLFERHYSTAQHGRTKPIKDAASKEASSVIKIVEMNIRNTPGAFELLTSHYTHPHTASMFYGEFLQPHYFGAELKTYISKLEKAAQPE